MSDLETTLNGILNGRVSLEQPAQGFRVAVDTVFVAAAVPAKAGDYILDLGCGVGGAMLCLACRVPGVKGLGIDIQGELVELCRRNIERNAFAQGLDVRKADALNLPADLAGRFDHVVCNPPYHDKDSHDLSPNAIKRTANAAQAQDLSLWIGAAAQALKPGGTLTLIHRADRKAEIISALGRAFGSIEILPLAPKQGAVPKRIIVRAQKGHSFAVTEREPLILHQKTGHYTESADAILRHAQGLAVYPDRKS